MEGLKPKLVIIYQSRDVTSDFEPILKSVTFKDYLDGKASDIDIRLRNQESLFFADWYPQINDRITLVMGYEESPMLDCGIFWCDEVKLTGGRSGDECSVRALSVKASGLNSSISKKSHERRSVASIANEVAKELDCKVVGDTSGYWSGIQKETGLQFLSRVARETGRILKIEGETLVLYPIEGILDQGNSIIIDRRYVIGYNVSDKAAGRISVCTVKWWDVKTKQLIQGTYDSEIKGGGAVTIWEEVDSAQVAIDKAKNYITDRNKKGVELTLDVKGDVRLRAGICVSLTGFGHFDKTYYISEATHTITKTGYKTNITLQDVRDRDSKK